MNGNIIKIVVSAFIKHQGKFLIVKRAEDDDFMPGFWELPGGGLEFGENTEEGLIREIQEECGVKVTPLYPGRIESYQMKNRSDKFYVELFYVCSLASAQEITLSHEHSKYSWITLNQLSDYNADEFITNVVNHIHKLPHFTLD